MVRSQWRTMFVLSLYPTDNQRDRIRQEPLDPICLSLRRLCVCSTSVGSLFSRRTPSLQMGNSYRPSTGNDCRYPRIWRKGNLKRYIWAIDPFRRPCGRYWRVRGGGGVGKIMSLIKCLIKCSPRSLSESLVATTNDQWQTLMWIGASKSILHVQEGADLHSWRLYHRQAMCYVMHTNGSASQASVASLKNDSSIHTEFPSRYSYF